VADLIDFTKRRSHTEKTEAGVLESVAKRTIKRMRVSAECGQNDYAKKECDGLSQSKVAKKIPKANQHSHSVSTDDSPDTGLVCGSLRRVTNFQGGVPNLFRNYLALLVEHLQNNSQNDQGLAIALTLDNNISN
jgi:hypothetical protein